MLLELLGSYLSSDIRKERIYKQLISGYSIEQIAHVETLHPSRVRKYIRDVRKELGEDFWNQTAKEYFADILSFQRIRIKKLMEIFENPKSANWEIIKVADTLQREQALMIKQGQIIGLLAQDGNQVNIVNGEQVMINQQFVEWEKSMAEKLALIKGVTIEVIDVERSNNSTDDNNIQ